MGPENPSEHEQAAAHVRSAKEQVLRVSPVTRLVYRHSPLSEQSLEQRFCGDTHIPRTESQSCHDKQFAFVEQTASVALLCANEAGMHSVLRSP